jgi:hypothetical protein
MEKVKVYNTISKRYLQVDGQQYKKLIQSGYIHQGNQLLPPNILSHKFSINDESHIIDKKTYFELLPELDDVILSNLDIQGKLSLYFTNQYYNRLFKTDIKNYMIYLQDTLSALSTFYHDKYKLNWDFENYYYKNKPIHIYFLNQGFQLNDVGIEFYITHKNNIDIINKLSQIIIPFKQVIITRKSDQKKIVINSNKITINDILNYTLKFWNKIYYETIGNTQQGLNIYHIDKITYDTLYVTYNNIFT